VLTFLHGIVDAESVLLCFLSGTGADARVLDAEPTALDYGQSLVLTEIAGADLAKDDVEPVVITGELELVSGLDCADALELAHKEQDAAPTTVEPPGSAGAGGGGASGVATGEGGAGGEGGVGAPLPEPPRLRVGQLPIIPAGTIDRGRSYLFVGTGCIGGPAFAGQYAQAACGEEYTPATPTLSGVLVALSRRTQIGSLGLQVAHASAATGMVNVFASRIMSDTANSWIASGLEYGALVPGTVQPSLSAEQYGVDSPFWQIELLSDFTSVFAERWSAIKMRAGLSTLVDGRSYTLVLLGPAAGFARKGFWNPSALSVVPNDPTRPADE
jgi:hypothetical protein